MELSYPWCLPRIGIGLGVLEALDWARLYQGLHTHSHQSLSPGSSYIQDDSDDDIEFNSSVLEFTDFFTVNTSSTLED